MISHMNSYQANRLIT